MQLSKRFIGGKQVGASKTGRRAGGARAAWERSAGESLWKRAESSDLSSSDSAKVSTAVTPLGSHSPRVRRAVGELAKAGADLGKFKSARVAGAPGAEVERASPSPRALKLASRTAEEHLREERRDEPLIRR